ncbi:polysaccharide deacetylase family protein [Lusitaniella coriacea]|uniref:polysaccharide deacetylase family protein n=1 Tax=Lusitaniella coriacea TaxID=1983105 RepID=UPI001D13F34E|nr:polysaccharide deacetylase family protein [Lusitaniella coriacea]
MSIAFFFGILLTLAIYKTTVIEIPVFGFHDIVDLENSQEQPPNRPLANEDFSKQDLATFIEYLVKKNYWFLSSQELYDYFLREDKLPLPKERKKKKPVLLSFDDGYQSAHNNILAILEDIEKRYNKKIKIVWFINPAFMGKDGSQLAHASCQELRVGVEKGYYDIQSHGLHHENLILLDPKKLEIELAESQKQLKDCTETLDSSQNFATHIAYPFGAVNPQVEKETAKYYLSGYLYNSRILRPSRLKNRYLIPRLTVNKKTTLAKLKLLAAGGWL